MKKWLLISALLTALALVWGCGLASALSEEETAITLSDSGSTCDAAGVVIDGSTVTITAGGAYSLTGSLSDGQLVIAAPEDAKVTLTLNGVSLIKRGHAAIYAPSADKLILTSAPGSENLIQSTGVFAASDKVDAAVYARCDLTLSGGGVLNISSHTGHAVYSKDDIKLKSGTVNLEAALKGLYGKDSVTIDGGVLSADVGTDALASTGGDGKGAIRINGGTLNLLAQKDGLDATGEILVTGGELTLNAGNGKEGKGLASDASITVSGGTLTVSAVDDALSTPGAVTLSGGTLCLSSSDDGIHAGGRLTLSGCELSILQCYEGLEAQVVEISGGEVRINARDDGINAAGGNDGSNRNGIFGGDPFGSEEEALISFSGGRVWINAQGDGVDSNGYLRVSGGELYVSGPTNSGNGALDYGIEGSITGGTVVAVGAPGMAVNFGESSTQGSILLTLQGEQDAGSTVSICDEKARILAHFEPEKRYSCVVISAPGLCDGGSYTVAVGTELYDITLDGLIYGSGYQQGRVHSAFGRGQNPPAGGFFSAFGRPKRGS